MIGMLRQDQKLTCLMRASGVDCIKSFLYLIEYLTFY